jgi:hypothetical protein
MKCNADELLEKAIEYDLARMSAKSRPEKIQILVCSIYGLTILGFWIAFELKLAGVS